MPGRDIPLITHEIYHVFNRGVAAQPTFLNKRDFLRAQEILFFYQHQKLPFRYSKFLTLSHGVRQDILKSLTIQNELLVEIIAFCLMPNHFHLLLKQRTDNGISKYLSNFTNSYTRYLNTKNKRSGPLFQGKFKAIRVETNEQLMHLSRYIHLNPYSTYLVKTINDLENYQFSSLPEYLGNTFNNFCAKSIILDHFNKLPYKQFIFDQADYQRNAYQIKHMTLENEKY